MKITKEEERSKKKTSTPIDFLLNESYTRDFFEQNLLPKLNLSEFKILNCKINPLKITSNRSVVEFKLQLVDSKKRNNNQKLLSKSIVGKWSSDCKNDFEVLQELWHKGFDRGNDHLKICEPIAYFPDYNFTMTSKASGLRLKDILMEVDYHDVSMLERYVTQAAMWLAKLHSTQVTYRNIYSMQMEEKKLNDWFQHLSILYPDFAKKLHSISSCILEIERSLNSKCFVLIHHGFHPDNIFVDGPDTTVIDFAHSCIFDPALDLGYFIARILCRKREYHPLLNTVALEKRFLDEYTAKMSAAGMSIEHLERVDLYKARTFLRHLHSKLSQHFRYKHNKPNPIDYEYWANKAEECLKRWM